MKAFLRMFSELPLAVKVMLLTAIARSVSFFALLPFLPIYMHDTLGLDMGQVGTALGLCLLVATVTSVYAGYLADRFNKVGFMLVLDAIMTALYVTLPLVHAPIWMLVMLVVVNTASSSMSVTGNALLSDLLPSELRAKVFSLRYSLQNIGAVTGPFLGAWAARSDLRGPFWLAAGVTTLAFVMLAATRRQFRTTTPAVRGEKPLNFTETLGALRADRRLSLFTIGGILSMAVYGPLLTYLSEYLVVVESPEIAYRMVGYISAANAIVVIALQYYVGRQLREHNLLRWLTWGIAAFVIGLVGLSLSTSIVPCIVAVAVFTVGEVIVVPAEYTFIDSIAPSHMRGSYFGVQNLIHLGVAIGPVLCGVLLTHAAPQVMFYALIGVAVASWLFYVAGCRTGAPAGAAAAVLQPQAVVAPEQS